jgi:hypothetical protein
VKDNDLPPGTVLHPELPPDMWPGRGLPGIAPVKGPWLWCDTAYAGQMAERRALLRHAPGDVVAILPQAIPAVEELCHTVEAEMPRLGFSADRSGWHCPDGQHAEHAHDMASLGKLCQQDFCIMQSDGPGQEHILTAAVLCFPASWQLSEKIGLPLIAIHDPIDAYDASLARRVQRLFDGIQPGRPLWRFNQLWYDDPTLFQPRSQFARRSRPTKAPPYLRCERQTLLRLPNTKAVVFMIHTYVIPRAHLPHSAQTADLE